MYKFRITQLRDDKCFSGPEFLLEEKGWFFWKRRGKLISHVGGTFEHNFKSLKDAEDFAHYLVHKRKQRRTKKQPKRWFFDLRKD